MAFPKGAALEDPSRLFNSSLDGKPGAVHSLAREASELVAAAAKSGAFEGSLDKLVKMLLEA